MVYAIARGISKGIRFKTYASAPLHPLFSENW